MIDLYFPEENFSVRHNLNGNGHMKNKKGVCLFLVVSLENMYVMYR